MVTDRQVRRLMKLMQTEKSLSLAAAKAGMDEKTARKYGRLKKFPSQVQETHTWRTRPDPVTEGVFSFPLFFLTRIRPVPRNYRGHAHKKNRRVRIRKRASRIHEPGIAKFSNSYDVRDRPGSALSPAFGIGCLYL